MSARILVSLTGLLAVATPHAGAPFAEMEPSAPADILVISPSEDDPRIALVLDGVSFWNATFASLGLDPPLGVGSIEVEHDAQRALENYARRISQRAGRSATPGGSTPGGSTSGTATSTSGTATSGIVEPAPPRELLELPGRVVVLLSVQRLMPFAWPLPSSDRYFVAIPGPPGDPPGTTRGPGVVIAHELGHVLGLKHNRDPSTLMCSPCGGSAASDPAGSLPPLTPADRARLLAVHGTKAPGATGTMTPEPDPGAANPRDPGEAPRRR